MKATEMSVKDRGIRKRIFVSNRMRNDSHNWDEHSHNGWWYCVKGGKAVFFSEERPYSGCNITKWANIDVFDTGSPIDTKERFLELLSM